MVPKSKIINIDEFNFDQKDIPMRILDVRSPSEFLEDHMMGAENYPVLNDEERSIVGTLYKKNNFSAKQLGAKLISKNISIILDIIEKSEQTHIKQNVRKPITNFLIYCWRGGMRSHSLFTVMDLIGYNTYVLNGGYKAYRSWINNFLTTYNFPRSIVVHGPSGTGKTEILNSLQNEDFPIINLEKYANHSGSVFGNKVGRQPSQKYFETLLAMRLLEVKNAKYLVFEAESRKIGKILLPNKLYSQILKSEKIWIELPLQIRAQRISKEYDFSKEEFHQKFQSLKKYIPSHIFNEINLKLLEDNKEISAELLLKEHYDAYYKKFYRNNNNHSDQTIVEESFDPLLEKVRNYLKSI
jgi:tRNA 2-selenouridine synthase